MVITNLWLVAYSALRPGALSLDKQETRVESWKTTARIREDGSVLLVPDAGEGLVVPSDGTVVSGRIGWFFRKFCVCSSMEAAAQKLEELAAGDEVVQIAEAIAPFLGPRS